MYHLLVLLKIQSVLDPNQWIMNRYVSLHEKSSTVHPNIPIFGGSFINSSKTAKLVSFMLESFSFQEEHHNLDPL